MFGPEKYIDFMESTPRARSVWIADFFKHISIAIWLKSLEYQYRGRDICPFLEKSTWNQPIPQSLRPWLMHRHGIPLQSMESGMERLV